MTAEPFVNREIRASAGSGKTFQLTSRYLALLAAGVEPDAILATTFTRKAAGEILDRVLERLAKAAGDGAEANKLADEIQTARNRQQEFVALLRRLLRSLHRLRIGTLDSFCISLAGNYCLELGLPSGWSICDEADDTALQAEALEGLLEQHAQDIGRLFPFLSKGEVKRAVREELLNIIGKHSDCFRESQRPAWERLQLPAEVDEAVVTAALEQLRVFDFSICRHKNFLSAQVSDVANFERQDWLAFIGAGIAAKVLAGETIYCKKPIPAEAQTLYGTLIEHARHQIVKILADQTRATWDLLDRFHRDLWALKQSTGALRFLEVTQSIVTALARQTLRADALAFRLDGAIEHLLLDEFQDTSLTQWRVLEPIAARITKPPAETPRSFFCVGDIKQAIYGWRGGLAEIFDTLESSLGKLERSPLVESHRSAQPVIDVVNRVFGNLRRCDMPEKCQAGIQAWADRFELHTTAKAELAGYVCLRTGPAEAPDNPGVVEQRSWHCAHVAAKINELLPQVSGRTIGVLCRKNDTVAHMIFELRYLKVEASEEGGNALTDSPAVEVVLSLFALADHPGHSAAWFHLRNSPLDEHLRAFPDAERLSRQLRHELASDGYGSFVNTWAQRLAPACNRRDLSRLQQLVEMAFAYQPRSTLRADDFVRWIREQRVPDPSGANVRVMTIHAAKGLQFDIVVLPELDAGLTSQPPAFVIDRDPKSLEVNFVCRYASEAVQKLLTTEEQRAFELDRQHNVEESLSSLYVALTRAVHALYLFIPGPRIGRSDRKDGWYKLLLQTLAGDSKWTESTLLFEHGDAKWFQKFRDGAPAIVSAAPAAPEPIAFRPGGSERRRGLEHVAPSRREGQGRVLLDRIFHPPEGTGLDAGTLYHAWLATIRWLDEGPPTDESLEAATAKLRADLPAEIRDNLDSYRSKFRAWLGHPDVSNVLRRSAYSNPQQSGFPRALTTIWKNTIQPLQVELERRFLVCDGDTILNGSFDRIVWLWDGKQIVAADVLDFKTDALGSGDAAALAERTEHYRPQLEAYRRAAARVGQIPEERIATRLVFVAAGCVVGV